MNEKRELEEEKGQTMLNRTVGRAIPAKGRWNLRITDSIMPGNQSSAWPLPFWRPTSINWHPFTCKHSIAC